MYSPHTTHATPGFATRGFLPSLPVTAKPVASVPVTIRHVLDDGVRAKTDFARNPSATLPQCSACTLRSACMPAGLNPMQADALNALVHTRKKVRRGESLFRSGDPFVSLYAIRSGFFKTRVATADGRDQVTGFQMAGDMLGMDGIGSAQHGCDAIALEDSLVCVIPYTRLTQLAQQFPALQHHFHQTMSREIVREHGIMLLLGSLRAEERLASFLLNLSQRFTARGYSACEFILRMTREEIGSYLGLKLETVSRAFSKFQQDGLLTVQQKHICISDAAGLKRVMG